MRLTRDETRALTFIALLLALSAVARLAGGDAPVRIDAPVLDVDTLAERAEAARAERERRDRPLADGERMDPNIVPAMELDRLPGVGPTVAARIVAARDSGGGFRSVADLAERVAGIGEVTARRIAPHLDLPGTPADLPVAGRRRRSPPPTSVLHARDGAAGDASRRGPQDAAPAPIDLNRATTDQLVRLPGIGPVIAGRIVAYRDSTGGFDSVDELERVSGIGPKTLARLRPRLRTQP